MKTQAYQHGISARKGLIAFRIAACLVVCAAVAGCSKAAHYRAHQDAKSLFATLHKEIKPGDSIERVQELLGQGETPRNRERLFAATQNFAQRAPQSYPDGVQDGDVFLDYRAGDMTVSLQYRGGRLMNFNPKDFEKVPELIGARSD